MKRYDVDWEDPVVLTEGTGLYVRIARGVYHQVDRRGRRKGIISWQFDPRPRWKVAHYCDWDLPTDGLTCPMCGLYDMRYAETGVRSYCVGRRRDG